MEDVGPESRTWTCKCIDGETSVKAAPLAVLVWPKYPHKTSVARMIHLFTSILALPNDGGQE